MFSVDNLHINFDPSRMLVLNLAMAFLMFGVALDIRLSDFRKVVMFPRAVMVGLIVQYLTFPLLTLGVIYAFGPPTSVALGMVLVSMCPSGNITNFLVHFAKANTALSVTLNAIIILSAAIITPLGFLFWAKAVPDSESLRRSFSLDFWEMALIILRLIVAPLALGMWLFQKFPEQIERIRPWVQKISLVLFFAILLLALLANKENIVQYLGAVFLLVAVHNFLALANGYGMGKLFRLPENDCRTLVFEGGVHNTALGLILIFQFFDGLGGMALIAAWWGIWDLVTGISLAAWWRKRPV